MTCFNDHETPYPYLEIVESKSDLHAKSLTLKVHPPLLEWIEDVLTRNKETLERNKSYDAVFALLFTYDHTENVLQTFCENWCLSTNTVSTFIGELSISLWDLRNIEGLHVHGSFYDEVIPSAKELTYVDVKGKPFLRRRWPHLFLAFYRLTKGVIDDVSFLDWVNFWEKRYKLMIEKNCPNSWSDCFIGLHSSFVILRHDDNLIVEPYSPNQFSRQFGFCQDVPGILTKHHFDGSLLALVQLWDSCVRLGSLSKLNIPMRPLDNGPFMTREYSDWWPAHRETVLRRNTHIILRGPKKNDTPSSTKGDQLQLDGQDKLSVSSKSKVVTEISNPLDKVVEKSLDIVPFCSDTSKPLVSLNGVAIDSTASSSNESTAVQEPRWKCLKKKYKDLSDQHREFADLDFISIDTAIFEDGISGSTMPLAKLAHQVIITSLISQLASLLDSNFSFFLLGLLDVSSNIFGDDVFGEDCVAILIPSSVLKSPNLSLDNAMTQATNKDPLAKLSENVESFQNILTTNMVTEENDNRPFNVPKDLVRPLQWIALNFETQKAISIFKLSYVSGLWRTLCACITRFSIESSENLIELEKGVALILKGLQEVNVVDLSSLEVLLADFFKKHRNYDVVKLSSSQKITRDAHQELLSVAKKCLHTANDDKVKMDQHLGELQKVLERVEKELAAWTSKKKKTILLIEEHQKKLSKNQETITNIEGEIHALEKSSPLSETETKELAKLKEIAKTSCLQILGHKLFP
ncbi:hypothetical protein FXO37_12975 [Capsicum annuum]|nr:hypothetical protein FXO37_12975 [Capsicum annuum]